MRKEFILLIFLSCILITNDIYAIPDKDDLEEDTLTFKEIFDFQVGDVFQYVRESSSSAGGVYPTDHWTKRYSIVSKDVSGDTLRYAIQGVVKYEHWCQGLTPGPFCDYTIESERFNGTLVYIDSSNHFLNMPLDSLVRGFHPLEDERSEEYYLYSRIRINNGIDGLYEFSEIYDGTLIKEVGGEGNIFYYDEEDGFREPEFNYYAAYAKNLGLILETDSYFEGYGYNYLEGYIKGNDTIGKVLSDNTLLAINETKENNISIFPNPARDIVYIDSGNGETGIYFVKIINCNGERILKEKVLDGSIDIKNLPKGLYILRISFHDDILIKKLILK